MINTGKKKGVFTNFLVIYALKHALNNCLSFCQLTAKNIQCMRTLLNLAHCHGAVLGTSWQLVLATLQVLQPPSPIYWWAWISLSTALHN